MSEQKPLPPLDPEALRAQLAKRPRQRLRVEGFRESAVLVPLLSTGSAFELLYTVRQPTLPTHAGQIAFPGGKREPADPSLDHTALREAGEEVGIPADAVTVLGQLDDIVTPIGFVITPVVRWPLSLLPDPNEVAEVFTVSLPQLPTLYKNAGQAEWSGYRYTKHEFYVETRRIWGATAAITMQLLGLLGLIDAPPPPEWKP
jgi:8-oxo-dGTP pyrophosphatase MutT (NUDIX family)